MHIGKHIQAKIEERGLTVAEFARRLSCSRTNAYKIFAKPSVDAWVLMHISLILEHDFFADLSAEFAKRQDTDNNRSSTNKSTER